MVKIKAHIESTSKLVCPTVPEGHKQRVLSAGKNIAKFHGSLKNSARHDRSAEETSAEASESKKPSDEQISSDCLGRGCAHSDDWAHVLGTENGGMVSYHINFDTFGDTPLLKLNCVPIPL